MSTSNLIQSLRQLSYACQIQAGLYHQGELVYAIPEVRWSASLLLHGRDPLTALSPLPGLWDSAQTLQNPQGEQYLYYALNASSALLLGPWMTKPSEDQRLLRLARQLMDDPAVEAQLLDHYHSLPQLDADNVFYLAQLVVRLFEGQRQDDTDYFPDVRKLYLMNSIQNQMTMFRHPPFFLEQELGHGIQHGNQHKALDALSEINRLTRATLAHDPLRSLKNSLIGSCALCSRAAIAGGVEAGEAFTLADSFIQTLEELNNVTSLAALEEDMVIRFTAQVAALRDSQVSSIVRGAMRYIDEHLSDKLRVSAIAKQVYVHPDYLSARFKQETGEGISRYIQRRRVQEACRFLRYSAYPIAQIAGYYQFSSQSAFTKVFKQYQGLTPRQYREWGTASTIP